MINLYRLFSFPHPALIPIWIAITLLAPANSTGQPPEKPTASTAQLQERFGEQQFSPPDGFVLKLGLPLPDLAWEKPELVATVLPERDIPTRWFNDRLEEVNTANEPGRYYAYGEAPAPSGPVIRRAMTCCCVNKDMSLAGLAEKWIASASPTNHESKEDATAVVSRWRTTEAGAVELAAWLEAGQQYPPGFRKGQWQMENATRHVRLKRKLMGLEGKPLVIPTARPREAGLAGTLRNGSLEEAGVTASQVQAVEDQLDEWFASSQEPMGVVIARNGVIVISKGYGKSPGGSPVTVDTPMRLDSAMKPLIGLQLAMYVDRKAIRLDEPMGNYLPEFNVARDRDLTFRAGHAHVTGIHFPWDLAFSRLFYFHTWHEGLIAHCKREWEPGAKYRYGVVGVILSVRALELLRGRNYWDAMERDMFEPLGIRNVWPGGTGFSAESMARIGVLLANHGSYGKWELFSTATYQAILPTTLKPHFPALDRRYGIGLQDASQHLGVGSYGHGGGCGTLLVVNPTKHLVFAMVRNGQGKNYKEHRSAVMKLLREWPIADVPKK